MSEYLMEFRTTVDALRASGSNIEEEIIRYVVDGLDENYRSFLTQLHFNPAKSFDELVSHLLQEEDLLKRTGPAVTTPIAFTAQQTNQQPATRNNTIQGSYYNHNYLQHYKNHRGRGRFHSGGRFNGARDRGSNYYQPTYPRTPTYNQSTTTQLSPSRALQSTITTDPNINRRSRSKMKFLCQGLK